MNLTRLVYYSQRNPSEELDTKSLIETCKRNNARLHLTGLLHYNGDHFIQVIEGGRIDVSELYHRIARDPRHANIILLSCTDVRERMFPTWSMALHQGMNAQTRKAFLRYFSTDMVNPETVNVDTLLDALQDMMMETPTKLTISV
ncbi:FAD-dependent sensor of blue light [Litoreibacter meonggei]|uniref:FAD-dependent sensor of blue light n=1 Tax=Litoreibacter meonggei TaxID=1049199 RepID=A0A497VBY3_9RHOB|nr:BLUF domain-containing protein [Litoreibacter meonggei]RLJ41101.1 FAD-dependent sensor of blue light [Litoreibacter meonggei]